MTQDKDIQEQMKKLELQLSFLNATGDKAGAQTTLKQLEHLRRQLAAEKYF